MTAQDKHTHSSRKVEIAALSAALLCLLVFLRSLSCDFINLDDPVYILNNSAIRQLDMNLLGTVFSKPYYFGWLPLTYLSFAVDYQFWGLNPLGYHLSNTLLHACNAGLVVLLADRFFRAVARRPVRSENELDRVRALRIEELLAGGSSSNGQQPTGLESVSYAVILLLVGLLWGLHPLRVESVVWVSQRKDVLNGLFSLGSILFYLRYLERMDLAGCRRSAVSSYCISLCLFAFSLLAKQVSVVLPVLLLLIDWYPLHRIRRGRLFAILLEKLPYLLLSLAVSMLTIYFAAQSNVMISAADFPYYARALVSGNAVFEYCRFLVFPVGIQPYFVIGDELQTVFVVKSAIVIFFTAASFYLVRRKPAFAATWLCFLLPLLPVLAFTQTADDTAFASRYTYLPSVAPTVAFGILLARLAGSGTSLRTGLARLPVLPLVTVLVIGYGAISLHLIAAWQNAGTLWTRQIELQPLGRAYTFRGIYYFTAQRYPAALEDFARSIKIAEQAGREDVFNLIAYHGETLRALGRHEEAVMDFTTAINLSGHRQYYYFRGSALQALGRFTEAALDFRQAGAEVGPIKWFPARNTERQLQ